MKLMWFHLMPYLDLPDDFKEKHPSVWVTIDPNLFDPQRAHHMYNEFMDELEFAAECGFDAICVNEHHSNAYGLMPSPNLIATALARRTQDTVLCVLGNSLALYNPPTRVAEEFAMIDCISGGRMIAGFPVGTPMDTCYAYSQNPSMLRDRYREAHDLIIQAWTAKAPFTFNGRYNQQRWVNAWPRPIQKPHPPIYIPGGGSIETWEWCARMDYNYSFLSFGGYIAGQAMLEGFWDQVGRLGKDESPHRASFAQIVCVAESDAEAEKLYAEHCLYFFNRCLHVYLGYSDPPGYRTLKTIQQGKMNQLRAEQQKVFMNLTWKELVEKGFVIAGSPATVRERCEHMIESLRVGHVFCLFHIGDMPDEKVRHSTKLFAERVMPGLHGLWPEWKDDKRWWIKPYEGRVRPELSR